MPAWVVPVKYGEVEENCFNIRLYLATRVLHIIYLDDARKQNEPDVNVLQALPC